MTFHRCIRIATLAVLFVAAGTTVRGQPNLGPFYDQFPLTLEPGIRTEAAGPFLYDEEGPNRFILAMPPVMSLTRDLDVEATEFDFLYPLFTYDRYGQEYRLQLGQLLSFAGSARQDESEVRRFTVFPFYFQQRGPGPEDDYTALLPFYGTIRKRLFRDQISFVMLPLYVQSRKRDVVTDNYLYPLFHQRHGEGLRGWQLWPLVGREHKDVTTRTNDFGDPEPVAGHDKFNLFWPVYYNNTTGVGTTNPMHSVGVLPLFAVDRSPGRDATSVLWPLFNFIDDRARRYQEWHAPYPFIQFARGEGKTMSRVWPLFGTARNATLKSEFVAWPLYRHTRFQSEPAERERTRILLFLYSDISERNTQTHDRRQRTDLWPFFTARRDVYGNERFQILAPIEPILANSKSVERNWSPLWSVWRAESNATTRARSKSFLWNLYRMDATPDTKNVSLLFGLFQYDTDPAATRWRLFHVPVATDRKTGAPAR